MKTHCYLFLLLLVMNVLPGQQVLEKNPVIGEWAGTIDLGVAKLRVEFVFESSDDKITGSMKSPDQSEQLIPIKSVTLEEGKLFVTIPTIAGSFEGLLSNDPKQIAGTWKQGGSEFPLILKPEKARGEANRPQLPRPPFPYESNVVTFENEDASIALEGTLTLPNGKGPFPAGILISGSGPQDRDETLMGHKPFAVIADHLTRKGIAVLRYDDRGVGKSKGDFSKATTEDFASDANAAWKFLSKHGKIDSTKTGMIGHSEGGIVGPIAFRTNPDIAWQVLLAAPGLPLRIISRQQTEIILKQAGLSDEAIQKSLKINEESYALYDIADDEPVPVEKLEALAEGWWKELNADDRKAAAPFKSLQKANLAQANSPWIRFLLKYDPVPDLQNLSCPVLVLNGENDVQVIPKPNLQSIEKALKEGGNEDFEIHERANLNHLFQNCKTGAPAEYGQIPETFDVPTLKLMSNWILSKVVE